MPRLKVGDSVQLFESEDCSGKVHLITKNPNYCEQQTLQSPRNQKANFWKCKVPPFRSVAGESFVPDNLSLDDEIETYTPKEERVTLLAIDNTDGADPIQASLIYQARFAHVQNNTNRVPIKKVIDSVNDKEIGYPAGVPIFKNLLQATLRNDWKATDIFGIWQGRTRTGKLDIPVGIKTVIVQIVGVCGKLKVYTNHFIKQDFYVDGTKFVSNVRNRFQVLQRNNWFNWLPSFVRSASPEDEHLMYELDYARNAKIMGSKYLAGEFSFDVTTFKDEIKVQLSPDENPGDVRIDKVNGKSVLFSGTDGNRQELEIQGPKAVSAKEDEKMVVISLCDLASL
ncbi:hypothetical protein Fcan01_10515 [Folsomia candida]|uniref:Uncharacterized protein n=1 Tax=Folsomia candida TaxID=158441 RepID=A0A226ECL6_FOLCA|nr:hypothetical protein Fcan01_10515 [Folsomia candida]